MLAWEEAQIAIYTCSNCKRRGHLEGSIECERMAEARQALWEKLHRFEEPPSPKRFTENQLMGIFGGAGVLAVLGILVWWLR